MPRVLFMPQDIDVQVEAGTTLLDAALDNEIAIAHDCGGNGICATCHVIIEEGFDTLNSMDEDEESILDGAENLTETSRLACRCTVSEDLAVRMPSEEGEWDRDMV